MGQSVTSLPPDYRARLFRQFAADAIHLAESMPDNARRAHYFLSLAARWHALALEAEIILDADAKGAKPVSEIQPADSSRLPVALHSFG